MSRLKALGWEAGITLRDCLADTSRWYLERAGVLYPIVLAACAGYNRKTSPRSFFAKAPSDFCRGAPLTEVLNARFGELGAQMDTWFAEQDAKFDKRFAEQDVRFNKIELGIDNLEQRMDRVGGCVDQLTALTAKVERTQFVHTWTLGVGVAALLVPQLNSMFGRLRAI